MEAALASSDGNALDPMNWDAVESLLSKIRINENHL